jgi:hypothetical protein
MASGMLWMPPMQRTALTWNRWGRAQFGVGSCVGDEGQPPDTKRIAPG